MRTTVKALRVTVFIDGNTLWHHKPLFYEIVHRAKVAGLDGASVLRGVEGFGVSSRTHIARLLSSSHELPVVIVLVDVPDRVRRFLEQLDELVDEGTVTVEEVEMIRYVDSSRVA